MKYDEQLEQLGLNTEQIAVYTVLLSKGFLKAGKISTLTGIKRGLVYKTLDQLEEVELVEKKDLPGKVSLFFPGHPGKLQSLLDEKEMEIKKTRNSFEAIAGTLTSQYNLLGGKPNVQFFEGELAIDKITSDFPEYDKEIRQWIDISVALKNFPKRTVSYIDKRVRRGISKRMIVPSSKSNLDYIKKGSPLTDFAMMPENVAVPTSIQVYDSRVTLLTLNDTKQVGMIIDDKEIADTFRGIFDTMWGCLGGIVAPQKQEEITDHQDIT